MAVRASVDNCAAEAEAAMATKMAGTDIFKIALNNSCPPYSSLRRTGCTEVAGLSLLADAHPHGKLIPRSAKPGETPGDAPESWSAGQIQSIDASTRYPAHMRPRAAGQLPLPRQAPSCA